MSSRPLVRERYSFGSLEEVLELPDLISVQIDSFDWLMERGTGRPNLMIWGLNDPTATIDQGFVLFDMIAHKEPRTDMHVFNEAGHFTYREHPEAFNRLLLDYVNNL